MNRRLGGRCVPSRVVGLHLVLMLAVSAVGCSLLEPRAGWTVLVWNGNGNVDFVVRFRSHTEAVDRVLLPHQDKFVFVGDRRPPGASLLVLDPTSCRPISIVDPLPEDHVSVAIEWNGDVAAHVEDPHKLLDPFLPELQAPITDACSQLDPAEDPAALAEPVVGVELGDGAYSCETEGEGSFGVRVEPLLGAIEGCRASTQPIDRPLEPGVVAHWNPAGAADAVSFAWLDTTCTSGATISLMPTGTGYRASVISISDNCEPETVPYSTTILLRFPIDANSIQAELERIVDQESGQEPG
jgi:hypothetical protein